MTSLTTFIKNLLEIRPWVIKISGSASTIHKSQYSEPKYANNTIGPKIQFIGAFWNLEFI